VLKGHIIETTYSFTEAHLGGSEVRQMPLLWNWVSTSSYLRQLASFKEKDCVTYA